MMAYKPPVTIAVLGRVGVGKSTLVNRILNRELAPAAYTGKPVTQKVTVYENEVDGVAYRVIDTPGLQDINKGVANDKKIIDCVLEKDPNVILYCISILPSTKISESDRKVVIEMNRVEKIWKRTIVVLTFANMVTTLGGNVNNEILQWTNDLQTTLNDAQVNNVKIKLCMDVYSDPTFDGIVSIPAGFNPGDKLPHSDNWIESLLEEVQRRKSYDKLKRTTSIWQHTWNYRPSLAYATVNGVIGSVIGYVSFGLVVGVVLGIITFAVSYGGLKRYYHD